MITQTANPMTTTSAVAAAVTESTTAPSGRSLWRVGGIAAVTAAAANTTLALGAMAAGVSFTVDGEAIPVLGFAQLTLFFSLIGVVIAVVCRRSAHPRRTFARITVALTVLSLASPLLVPLDGASRLVLEIAHVLAAAIVIPAIARRLPRSKAA